MLGRWIRASPRRIGIVSPRRRHRLTFAAKRRSSSTYYDSQSGRHVPVHDESRVTVYLRGDDVRAAQARALGAVGALVAAPPPSAPEVDLSAVARLLESASSDGARDFTTFLRLSPSNQLLFAPPNGPSPRIPDGINLCFEYTSNGVEGANSLAKNIKAAVAHCGSSAPRTSIGVFALAHYDDEDPIAVAAAVADLIDTTGGGSYVVLDPAATAVGGGGDGASVDGDAVVRLIEELAYLDVTGPTIKSRLVVPALDGDQLDECLTMGVNKYIVDGGGGSGPGRVDALRGAVEEQGKELVLSARR